MRSERRSDNAPAGSEADPIRVGVSRCLLGEEVRYDGGHKRDRYVQDVLGSFFEWVPVCPEVEAGLDTPRPAMRLVGDKDAPRMVTIRDGVDVTARVSRWAQSQARALASAELDGFILKRASPSCGAFRVKVYPVAGGTPSQGGVGLFARALMEQLPTLPVEEEGRLNDALLRETFIARVFASHRWRTFVSARFSVGRLVEFHARHKFLLQAHDETRMRGLGRIVAAAKGVPAAEVKQQYGELFAQAMARRATRTRHVNVLQHIAGFFRGKLEAWDSKEVHAAIADYGRELLPLVVPLTLIRHHVGRLGIEYIQNQVYLNPHPKELMLLNHV